MKRKKNEYIIYINKNLSTTGIGLSELKSKVFFFMGLLLFLKNSRYDLKAWKCVENTKAV